MVLIVVSMSRISMRIVNYALDEADITGVAYRDFERQMRARGVSRVYWERHRADGSIKLVMRELT